MQLTRTDIITTLDSAQLWGVNYKALASELTRRFRVTDQQAVDAIEACAQQRAIQLDSLGAVRRLTPGAPAVP